jgi:hypothetical protein
MIKLFSVRTMVGLKLGYHMAEMRQGTWACIMTVYHQFSHHRSTLDCATSRGNAPPYLGRAAEADAETREILGSKVSERGPPCRTQETGSLPW